MNERTGVVVPVASPSYTPDLLTDVNREIANCGADVAVVLVDNGGVLSVRGGAVSVAGRPPLRLTHIRAASFDASQDRADVGGANVLVLKPGDNLGWRDGTRAGTAWLLANLPDVSLVAISNDDIRLSHDFFGVMERTFRSVSGFGAVDSNIRNRQWLQRHPQFQQRGNATPGVA
jgi:GT2 family glycosyltransferase